ncbi:GNAT family N-acetyltransferase [Actinocorallia longicatena]|uniref:GNAT family N-acetyltransferase n=1 Tax=Actinocorallia longicatena TaxID=111803 RepID=UPI0031D1162C
MELITEPSEGLRRRLGDALKARNLLMSPELAAAKELYGKDDVPLEVYAVEDGELVGGLAGETWLSWLHVELLWVRDRGDGLGSRLLATAEEIARGRGCTGSRLETWSFQAPGFYAKQGYRIVGEVPDHPFPGSVDYTLIKNL